MNKDTDEAFDYFDLLAENAQSQDTINTSNRSRVSTNPFGGCKYQLRENDDLNARVASLTKKLEAMELRKVNGINTVKFVKFVRPWNTLQMNALQFQLLKRCCMIKQMLQTW